MIALVLVTLGIFVPSLSEGCGMRPSLARVINGEDAAPNSWPWQISLQSRGRHICGGSLIRPNWILTAAHCVYRNPNPSGYIVKVGVHMRTGMTDVQQRFRVKTLHKHKDFTMQNLKHDIALLELDRSAQLSDKVTTVCLPDQDADLNSKCYITGWGRTSAGPPANTLQQAKLPLVSHSDCRKKWRTIDSSAHLCAGEGRSGASGGCNGDSGGPLVCEKGGKWYLHGAVSFGMQYCPTTHYTVFTRITSYISWIQEKIGDEGGGPNPPLPTQSPRPSPPMTARPPGPSQPGKY
ncbi:Chymotrypsinogen B [Desmophyllum pertusum]|uniref:Chymotrypsinogen B n=1 Tax=Desmophyllum pertusum TaxID=174260 RepID=A0A9W9YZG2_9CNID|nr:Chymotrypsinogen B [Desmophyllum pertusum]